MKDKKANMVSDGIMIAVILVFFGFCFFFFNGFTQDFNDMVQESEMSNMSKTMAQDNASGYPAMWDSIYLLIFLSVWAMALVSAYYIDTTGGQVFFIFGVILLLSVFYYAMEASNWFQEFILDDVQYASYITQFPNIWWISGHLLELMIIVTFSIGGVLYSKR